MIATFELLEEPTEFISHRSVVDYGGMLVVGAEVDTDYETQEIERSIGCISVSNPED